MLFFGLDNGVHHTFLTHRSLPDACVSNKHKLSDGCGLCLQATVLQRFPVRQWHVTQGKNVATPWHPWFSDKIPPTVSREKITNAQASTTQPLVLADFPYSLRIA